MKQISRYIFWCIIIGITCNVVKLYFYQNDMVLRMEEGIYPWYFRLDFAGDALMSVAAVSSFVLYRQYFPSYISICYILIIVFVTITSLDTLGETLQKSTFFYSVKGIGTFVNFGVLFFAADTRYFPKVLDAFYYMCFFIMAACIINLGKVGLGASRYEYLGLFRDYTVFLFWVFPYFFLQDEPNKKKNLINFGMFGLIFVFILCISARSYLILYFLFLALKFKNYLRTRNGIFLIVAMVAVACIGYFVLINSSFSHSLEGAASNLAERSGDDSRSDQLRDFLSQYDTETLVQGVGPLHLWFWHSINDYYGFLDNQFLLMAWWAGLPTIITYVFFLVKSLFVKSEILEFEDIKGLKVIIGFWILACLGVAIYSTICSEHYYYFISFIIGLNACQYTKIIEPEAEEAYEDYEEAA